MKSVKTIIKSNEKRFIGKVLVFQQSTKGTTLGTIINVTKDRVIWVNDENEENWTWICPNGQFVSFNILNDGKDGVFIKALEVEAAYRDLQTKYEELSKKYARLEEFLKDINEYTTTGFRKMENW